MLDIDLLKGVFLKGRGYTLCKRAYSNIQKILSPKNENFQLKISDIFHISAQNIGGSNEYPQSMFLSRN